MNTQQIHSCAYCGNVAYYQLHSGKWCCQPAYQKCPALIKKNKAGLAIAYQNGLEERKQKSFTAESRFRQGSGNRGQTKENNSRIKAWSEKLHQRYENKELIGSFTGKKHKPETIDKIVKGMNSNRNKVICRRGYKGWYKGIWCDSSWELAYVIFNLEHRNFI